MVFAVEMRSPAAQCTKLNINAQDSGLRFWVQDTMTDVVNEDALIAHGRGVAHYCIVIKKKSKPPSSISW